MKKIIHLLVIATSISIMLDNDITQIFGSEQMEKSIYLEQICSLAKEIEIFPIDYIARNRPHPGFRLRTELTAESFRLFYDFCQLALDATPQDIDTCLSYLDEATPREKALLMSVFYIYVYPWEENKPITNVIEHEKYIGTKSWFAIQFVTDAFDLTIRKSRRDVKAALIKACYARIREHVGDKATAFPAVAIVSTRSHNAERLEENSRLVSNTTSEIFKSIDSSDIEINPWDGVVAMKDRRMLYQRIREKFPEKSRDIVTTYLFSCHCSDMFPGNTSGRAPSVGNSSAESKTVGLIAQQLLDSWEPTNELKELMKEPDKPLFDEIRELVAKMEVFPMDIYTGTNTTGPFGSMTVFEKLTGRYYSYWQYRYELTFDRFIPLFEFKERVYRAKVEEIDACIHRINEMTPKEKALLFTAIYIFECRKRPSPDMLRLMNVHGEKEYVEKERFIVGTVLIQKFDFSIDEKVYDRWFTVIEKYKDDTAVAFPAIDTPLEELKKEWEINREKCDQFLISKWNITVSSNVLGWTPDWTHGGREYLQLLASLQRNSPQDVKLFSMYAEYFGVFYFKLPTGIAPYSGNSSAFPKTLGDIATQILMSRDSYDNDKTPY